MQMPRWSYCERPLPRSPALRCTITLSATCIGLCGRDRLDEAVTAVEKARAADPANAAAANNLGLVYKQQGRLDMARHSLDGAVRIAPDFAEARLNRAMTMLLAGDFEAGWSEYEWRPKAALAVEHPLRLPLRGKTILLHAEQGLGDLIQFVRYVDPLQKLRAPVLVQCDATLAPPIRN